MLGSMLFTRGLTGHRVCEHSDERRCGFFHLFRFCFTQKRSGGFVNWGQHCNRYEPARSYLTLAVSVGLAQPELEQALALLAKTLRERDKKSSAAQQRKP